jgi:hypothetical protein
MKQQSLWWDAVEIAEAVIGELVSSLLDAVLRH